MSRIRFTEGSSDDELDKLIKKREKRLQKRKDIYNEINNTLYHSNISGFSRSNRTVDSESDSLYESSFAGEALTSCRFGT